MGDSHQPTNETGRNKFDRDAIAELLADLIALPTVNPMGRLYGNSAPVERPVIEYLEQRFARYDVQLERQPCSPIHESLLITVPGQTSEFGTLIEAHVDTVPADDWPDRAFQPRREGSRVFGRGACDDKGSLAAMVVALENILESGVQPPHTIWFLAAGDEEYGQTGIRHFIEQHPLQIGRAIFGEPTDCVPVIQHNGTIRWDVTVHGRSAHTSQPDLGANAIVGAARLIDFFSQYQDELRHRFSSPGTSGPSLTVTMINGGRTRNVVPDECTTAVDFRILPGMDGRQAVNELFTATQSLELPITHSDFQCFAPALNTLPDDPLVQRAVELYRETVGQAIQPGAVPYGSDAGWTPAGVPAIVLGPGNITQAHTVDEFVDLNQVQQCAVIYQELLTHAWSIQRGTHIR